MENRHERKSYFFALAAVLLWATSASAFKISLRYINFGELLFLASLSAVITVFMIILLSGRCKLLFQISPAEIRSSMLLGFLNPFLYYLILFRAFSLLPAQLAQPLNFIWPLMIVILSIPLLKRKVKLKDFAAIGISFLGVLIISTRGSFTSFKGSDPWGIFLALSSSLVWAFFWIYNTKNRLIPELKMFLNFCWGTIFISIYLISSGNLEIPPVPGIIGGLYIGLFEMGITFILWLKALRYTTNTARINNFIYLTPFLSLLVITLAVGERILLATLAGLLLIVAGIAFQHLRFSRIK
ncbi:MAG: DMT family transporter [Candidatus Cloacimonetes bacterium]|nr:DMT family transporter [Candidatus Cloacimonadota bacterium]